MDQTQYSINHFFTQKDVEMSFLLEIKGFHHVFFYNFIKKSNIKEKTKQKYGRNKSTFHQTKYQQI